MGSSPVKKLFQNLKYGGKEYCYSPLPTRNSFRLIEFSTDLVSHKPVFRFYTESLDNLEHGYVAISYAWDHLNTSTRIFSLDGHFLELSRTLSDLVQSLTKRHKTCVVWIDALCINQKDYAEKSIQVCLMGRIYSAAEQVIVWLGASTPEIERQFRVIDDGETHQSSETTSAQVDYVALFSLLERPWFRRIWVVQEVALGKQVVILCGESVMQLDALRPHLSALWNRHEIWPQFVIDNAPYRGLWCVTRLLDLRDQFQADDMVPYEVLLEACFHFLATDSRDRIYALRNMADKTRPVPDPDYTAITSKALLCSGLSLNLLCLAGLGHRKERQSLPSWVPELREDNHSEPLVLSRRLNWAAGGCLSSQPRFIAPAHLLVEAYSFDTITVTGEVISSNSVQTLQRNIREIIQLRESLPVNAKSQNISMDSWLEMVWKTLVMDMDIDDNPVPPEYGIHFREWLDILESCSNEKDEEKLSANVFHRTLGIRTDECRPFLTSHGYFGVSQAILQPGDEVILVPGCQVPLVVRRCQGDIAASPSDGAVYSCTLQGWSYLYGVMYGEVQIANSEVQTIIFK